MRTTTCAVCGEPFTTERNTARYCGGACRQRAHRSRVAGADEVASVVPFPTSVAAALRTTDADPTLADLTRAALVAADRFLTPQAGRAMQIARRLDAADRGLSLDEDGNIHIGAGVADTGSMIAALSKAHGEALDAALRGAARQADKVDELRERRAQRIAGGA